MKEKEDANRLVDEEVTASCVLAASNTSTGTAGTTSTVLASVSGNKNIKNMSVSNMNNIYSGFVISVGQMS